MRDITTHSRIFRTDVRIRDKLLERQRLSVDEPQHCVSEEVGVVPVVEPERNLVQIGRQVLYRETVIGADPGPLEQPSSCRAWAGPPRAALECTVGASFGTRSGHALPFEVARLGRNPHDYAVLSTATGIRTRVSGLRIRRPSPLDDSGGWAGEDSNGPRFPA